MSESPFRRDFGSPFYDGRAADLAWLLIALLILVGSASIVTYSYNHEETVVAGNVRTNELPSGMPPTPAMNFVRL